MAVVAVDMPFANPELLKLLADLHDEEEAVVPVTDSGLQPLHAVYSSSALSSLRAALESGHHGMRHALGSMTVRTVGPEEWGHLEPSERWATNLNRPEDLGLLTL
jgi:molybdopterin-guanine dinucleotide biosynthesis protein A